MPSGLLILTENQFEWQCTRMWDGVPIPFHVYSWFIQFFYPCMLQSASDHGPECKQSVKYVLIWLWILLTDLAVGSLSSFVKD